MKLIYRRLSVIGAVVLIIGSVTLSKKLGKKSAREAAPSNAITPMVAVLQVKNTDVPADIFLTGKLMASKRLELFSEVNGILLNENFKEGNSFAAASAIAVLDDAELRAQIKSQKSTFLGLISQILADMSIDFPAAYPSWKKYQEEFSFEGNLSSLPEVNNSSLKSYLSGKGVYTSFYNLKSQEVRLSKYRLPAPFSGTLSLASVDPGTLIRPGQKLGEFIQTGTYELETPVSVSDLKFLKVGDAVALKSDEVSGNWTGRLVRINQKLDAASQSVMLYIQVQGEGLKEGMFLNARLSADPVKSAFSIARRLLIDGNKVFVVEQDSLLKMKEVDIVRYTKDQAIVKGLSEDALLVNQVMSGAYTDMRVKALK